MAFGGLMRNTGRVSLASSRCSSSSHPYSDLLPKSWANNIGPYLPANAGEALWGRPDSAHLSAWAGLLVLLGWTAAAITAAAVRLKSQDA
jgi:ABC-2 type transport system permease protein